MAESVCSLTSFVSYGRRIARDVIDILFSVVVLGEKGQSRGILRGWRGCDRQEADCGV